jgi:uncharacterized protein YecT (DUF1311 family)/uncharacterized protein (DUF983 family)
MSNNNMRYDHYNKMGTCWKCGYTADVIGECPKCTQLELLQKQTKMMEDANRATSHQSSGGGSSSGSNDALTKLFGLAIGAFILYELAIWVWEQVTTFFSWIWGLITSFFSWIWSLVTWPFRFIWQSFENVIVGSTNLVGINHDPAWWETLILISVITFVVSFVSVLQPVKKEGAQEEAKSNLEVIKVGIIALIAIGVIACGVWVNPPAVVKNAEETVPEQKVETTSQEQAQPAPVAAPVEIQKAPMETAPATPVVDSTPFAPSFDCTKASNNSEKMICGDRNLSKLDAQLGQVYSVARDKAADKAQLKSEQIAWVKTSRACPDVACLAKSYEERIKQLSNQ